MNPYLSTAIAAAKHYGFDPGTFLSLIGVESGWAEDVIYGRRLSSTGAGGISQIMPETWQGIIDAHPELVRDFGAKREPSGRFNPTAALYAAAAHLSDLLRSAGGDYRQALGAYYAGWGGRLSQDGIYYANLVLGNTGTNAPEAQGATDYFDEARTQQIIAEARQQFEQNATEQQDRIRREILAPLEGFTADAPQPKAQTLGIVDNPLGGAAATSGGIARRSLADIQQDESYRAAIESIRRGVQERSLPALDLTPVQQASFGGIVSGIKDVASDVAGSQFAEGVREIGGGVAKIAAPVARPVLSYLNAEQKYIGHPLASAAVNYTPLRFLPKPIRGVTEDVLATVLVPSTFLMPEVGRAITLGSIMGQFGLKSLANPARLEEEYTLAKIAIRSMFPNQLRLAATTEVATKLAAEDANVWARRASAEKLSGQLARLKDEQQLLRRGGTLERKAFGQVVGTVDKEQIDRQIELVRGRLVRIQQEAVENTRLMLRDVGTSADPAITDAINKTEEAFKNVARMNQPGRFSPMRVAFWRKHVTGSTDELTQAFRRLIPDAHPPESLLTTSVDDLATKRGLNIAGLAADDPVMVKLLEDAKSASGKNIENWRASLEWFYNLGAEGAFDPKANPGTVFNWLIRASEPLNHIPLIGPALSGPLRGVGTFFQPIGGMEEPLAGAFIAGSRYRSAAGTAYMQRKAVAEMAIQNKFGDGLVGKPVEYLTTAYKGPAADARATGYMDRFFALKQEQGLTFSEHEQEALRKQWQPELEAAYKRDVGTVASAAEHQDWYDLASLDDPDVADRLRFLTEDVFGADRETLRAMGTSVGEIEGSYIPRRRVVDQQMQLGVHGQAHFGRTFKARAISDRDDFIGATILDGGEVEYNISNLLDWRLGQGAKKKAEQVTMRLMAANEDLAHLVEKPLLTRVKGPIDTKSDEFRQAVIGGFKREFDPKSAEAMADSVIKDLPDKLSLQQAERYIGREYRLSAPNNFADDAQRETATKVENWFAGRRNVPLDENFVGRSLEAMRSLLLSSDLSPIGFVQGARVFAQDPVSYIRSIGSSAAWNMTPQGRRVWMIQNAPNVRRAVRAGLQLGNPLDINLQIERKAGESLGAWMGRRFASGAIPPLDWLNKEMMDTVASAKLHIFNTNVAVLAAAQENPEIFGLLKGLPMFNAISKDQKVGGLAQVDLERAVADGLNNYIGPAEFSKISAEGKASFLEKMALLTPSWTRGNIGMILNAPKFGVKGVVARHLFMNQLALQASLATKLSLALSGKMPSFDPTSTDFLAVQTPTFRFHLFPTMSVFRMPFRLLAGRPDAEKFAEENIWKERATELSRFFEGRMAQGPRILVDLLQGEDFLGRKIDAPDRYIMKEMMPIIAQQVWESVDEGHISKAEVAERAGLEFLGSQTIPKTPFQLYREKIELLTSRPYDQVTSVERKQLEREHQDLRDLRERQKEYRTRRGNVLDQFFNLQEETRDGANRDISTFLDVKGKTPGFQAEYARLAADSLQFIGQQTDASIIALFGGQAEFEQAIRSKPANGLDEIARRYWSLSPDSFVDTQGNQWDMAAAYLDPDPDSFRDQLWRAYRETRDKLLIDSARTLGIPQDRAEQYVFHDWPSVRWRDPRASQLEVRRVGAQRAMDDLFSESPYQFINGQTFTPDEVQRLRDLRVSVEQGLSPMRAVLSISGTPLPDGSRRAMIARLSSQTDNPTDKKLLSWMLLWDRQQLHDRLRNPKRDEILVANPDILLFYPDRIRFLLSNRLLATPLGQNPQTLQIITAANAA